MTIPYKALLITCIPFSLHSMEQKVIESLGLFVAINNDQNAELILKHQSELNSLYKKTYDMLDSYDATNIKTTTTLLDIINTTKNLKTNKEILEQHIGLFSFNQNKKPLFQKNPIFNGSDYVSVCFARIKQYHNTLTKNEFITPTLEQIAQLKARNTAADFGLFLNIDLINAEKKEKPLPKNLALVEFQKLLDDIALMIKKTPEEVKNIAELLHTHKTTS